MLKFRDKRERCLALVLGCSMMLTGVASVGYATASEEGEKLFGQCRACHQVGPDAKHQFGPILNGVMDRTAAATDSYEYSAAFQTAAESGLFWDDQRMHEFLAAPMQNIPGTKMAFPGVADEDARASLIAYLRQFDVSGKSNAPVEETPSATTAVVAERKPATDFDVPTHGELHLGRIAHADEIVAWDIDIRPDGQGLPKGSGDAMSGVDLYDAQCAACHGDFGEGIGRWPILAGGQDTLTEERPEKTIGSYWPYLSTVYDYIRRAMPFGNARSLSDDDVYAITAYLLYLNDLVEEDYVLSSDNFDVVRLPNEGNFISDNRDAEPYRKLSEADLCMQDCKPEPVEVVQRARVLDVTPDQ